MAAIAFDPLEYTHELEASGVPRQQAEVHAKVMTTMFLHNFDALVTRDYLDARFSEFETCVEAKMDKRFSEMEFKVDKRFIEFESKVDRRFGELESTVDKQFTEVAQRLYGLEQRLELRFERIDSKFSRIYLMFAITMAAVTIPILQSFLQRI